MTSLKIAVVGSGISGLSAAWLLSKNNDVTLFEAGDYPGGHTNTVEMDIDGKSVPVDTGFICYNDATYPNLIAMFKHLNVVASPTSMSFGASMGNGAYEYSGGTWLGMVGQPANVFKPGHWRMILDILRFFRRAAKNIDHIPENETLAEYVKREGYSEEFCERHLLPMASAIWSSKKQDMLTYPAKQFMQFCESHGLLKLFSRPTWRSVVGGSRTYVDKLLADGNISLRCNAKVTSVIRDERSVTIVANDQNEHFDQVVIATHGDQALAMLDAPTIAERAMLSCFRYSKNKAVLHRDRSFMPDRKLTWSAWNYIDRDPTSLHAGESDEVSVTYWMNVLQKLSTKKDIFVTINPPENANIKHVSGSFDYDHPIFDQAAIRAQTDIWSIQGDNRTWYCGAHFGAGFHEDGLQAGLAVAEQLGGIQRPWNLDRESDRIANEGRSLHKMAAE